MATPKITRLDGESDEEFHRRRKREQQRYYRSIAPKVAPKVRAGDVKPRKNSPFTSEEWDALRRRSEESDKEYLLRMQRARHAKLSATAAEKRSGQRRAWRTANADAERDRHRKWAADNPEKVRANQKRYYERNTQKRLNSFKKWVSENIERREAYKKRWYADNPTLRNFYSATWRKAARIATPSWANFEKIQAIYAEAVRVSQMTGIKHHVDHYYPLQGKTVCGLHCEANLVIIPAAYNIRKRNRHPDEPRDTT